MKYQNVIFTVAPVGGHPSVKMCYTCHTPDELYCAKEAIIQYLDNLGTKWDKEDRQKG